MSEPSNDIDAQARALLTELGTPRRRARPRVSRALQDASDHEIQTPSGPVAAWRLGEGPAVLLVHGWEDDNALWGPLADRFASVGRSVVALDLPGHGFSGATDVSPAAVADTLVSLAEALGPIEAIVGHSYGCRVGIEAMAKGLSPAKAVMIASPVPRLRPRKPREPDFEVDPRVYARAREIHAEGEAETAEAIEKAIRSMTAPALVVHSIDDEPCPFENAQALCDMWPGAELLAVDGLGHRFVAQDKDVLERVVEFVEGF